MSVSNNNRLPAKKNQGELRHVSSVQKVFGKGGGRSWWMIDQSAVNQSHSVVSVSLVPASRETPQCRRTSLSREKQHHHRICDLLMQEHMVLIKRPVSVFVIFCRFFFFFFFLGFLWVFCWCRFCSSRKHSQQRGNCLSFFFFFNGSLFCSEHGLYWTLAVLRSVSSKNDTSLAAQSIKEFNLFPL